MLLVLHITRRRSTEPLFTRPFTHHRDPAHRTRDAASRPDFVTPPLAVLHTCVLFTCLTARKATQQARTGNRTQRVLTARHPLTDSKIPSLHTATSQSTTVCHQFQVAAVRRGRPPTVRYGVSSARSACSRVRQTPTAGANTAWSLDVGKTRAQTCQTYTMASSAIAARRLSAKKPVTYLVAVFVACLALRTSAAPTNSPTHTVLPNGAIYAPMHGFIRERAHAETGPGALDYVVRADDDANDGVPVMSDEEILHHMGMLPPHEVRDGTTMRVVDRQLSEEAIVSGSQTSFKVMYRGSVPESVRSAFEFSLETWADLFPSEVQIRISCSWLAIGGSTLAATTSPFFIPGSARGADQLADDTLYGSPMAASLQGVDYVDENDFHIVLAFNSGTNWHLDSETNAPRDRWDFITTALHEACHGLFFSGLIQVDTQSGIAGFANNGPGRFDRFIMASNGEGVAEACSADQSNFFTAVTNNGLRFANPSDDSINFGLYSPTNFQAGSSIYHHDPSTIDGDCERLGVSDENCSDLMTERLTNGYTQRNVGDPVMRVMQSMRGDSPGLAGETCSVAPGNPDENPTPNSGPRESSGELPNAQLSIPRWAIYTIAAVGGLGIIAVLYAIVAAVFRGR